MRRRTAALFSLVLFFVAACAPRAAPGGQQADPVSLLRAHYAAWNRVDADAVLATFADDVVIDDNGTLYTGYEQAREWVLRFMHPNQNVSPDGIQVSGQRLTWTWIRLGDAARQRLGVPEFTGQGEATVERGKITLFRIAPDSAANARLRAAYSTAVAAAMATQVAKPDADAGAGAGSVARTAGPSGAAWAVAIVASLLGAAVLAAASRRPS